MTAELFANTPSTTVSSGGTDAPASGTPQTWTVTSSSGFPAAATDVSQFHVGDPAATSEMIAVTNVTGDTWSVIRGAESTTPVAHSAGFTVQQVATAGVLGSFAQTGLGDLGGSGDDPEVTGTHLTDPLPTAQGGTGNDTGTAVNISDTLDQVPAPAANVTMNSHKLTNLANGASGTDAAAFGQLPSSGSPLALTAGGTGQDAASASALLTALGALQSASNLDDVGSESTALANLGGIPLSYIGAASGVEGLDSAQRIISPVGSFLIPAAPPVSRRPAYRPAVYAQIFQTGHGWTAAGGGLGSSNLNDTSIFIRGTQCATITTAANGEQAQINSPAGLSLPNMQGKMLRLIFQVASTTDLNYIAFYLGDSSFTDYFNWNVTIHDPTPGDLNYVNSGEWVTVDLQWADVFAAGGGYTINSHGVPSTYTGFTQMRFAVYDNSAGAVTVHLQAVEIAVDTTTTFPKGVVSITFDDSYQNVYDNGRPIMDVAGYRGTLNTIASVIGTTNYLTLTELQQISQVSDWEVAGHAYTLAAHNAGYQTLTAIQVEDEMRYLRAWLLSNGFAGDLFAYPQGYFEDTTDGVPVGQIAMNYWCAGRTIINETSEPAPGMSMPYRVKAFTGITDGSGVGGYSVTALVAAGGPLDRCASNGSWVILTFHQIIPAGGTVTASTQCTATGFQTVISALASYGMAVLPMGDVIRYYS